MCTTADMSDEASLVARRLWCVLVASGFSRANPSVSLLHVKGAFDPAWLQSLPMAIGEDRASTQKVSLLSPEGIERQLATTDVEAAYSAQPRTQVCENVGEHGGGWVRAVEIMLAGATEFPVACSAYQSRAGDASFAPHTDRWVGVITQIEGSKRLLIREDEGTEPLRELVLEAGDILIMPPDVEHEASTPEYSLHLNFEIFTDEVLDLVS